MSATSQPYGLFPLNFPSGRIAPVAIPNGIQSGYATAIGLYTPILFSGGFIIAATTGDVDGVFMGCEFFNSGSILETKRVSWAASTTFTTGTMIAYIVNDPNIQYRIQSSGSLSQTAIYGEYDLVNPGTVSANGFSVAQIGTSGATSGNSKQLRVLDLYKGPTNSGSNAWGDAYTDVIVEIAKPQRRATKAVA